MVGLRSPTQAQQKSCTYKKKQKHCRTHEICTCSHQLHAVSCCRKQLFSQAVAFTEVFVALSHQPFIDAQPTIGRCFSHHSLVTRAWSFISPGVPHSASCSSLTLPPLPTVSSSPGQPHPPPPLPARHPALRPHSRLLCSLGAAAKSSGQCLPLGSLHSYPPSARGLSCCDAAPHREAVSVGGSDGSSEYWRGVPSGNLHSIDSLFHSLFVYF